MKLLKQVLVGLCILFLVLLKNHGRDESHWEAVTCHSPNSSLYFSVQLKEKDSDAEWCFLTRQESCVDRLIESKTLERNCIREPNELDVPYNYTCSINRTHELTVCCVFQDSLEDLRNNCIAFPRFALSSPTFDSPVAPTMERSESVLSTSTVIRNTTLGGLVNEVTTEIAVLIPVGVVTAAVIIAVIIGLITIICYKKFTRQRCWSPRGNSRDNNASIASEEGLPIQEQKEAVQNDNDLFPQTDKNADANQQSGNMPSLLTTPASQTHCIEDSESDGARVHIKEAMNQEPESFALVSPSEVSPEDSVIRRRRTDIISYM